jgi:hypothetical protein
MQSRACRLPRYVRQSTRVHEAREATRNLLEEGRIALQPNAQRTPLVGTVRLKGLAAQVLNMAGVNKVVAGA